MDSWAIISVALLVMLNEVGFHEPVRAASRRPNGHRSGEEHRADD